MQSNIKAIQCVLVLIVKASFEKIRKQNANLALPAKSNESLTRIESQTGSRKELQPAIWHMSNIRRCTRQKGPRLSAVSGATSRTFMECPDSRRVLWIAADSAIDYFVTTFATRYCSAPMEAMHRVPRYEILQRQGDKSLRIFVTEPKNKVGITDRFYLHQMIKQCNITSVQTGVRSHGQLAGV